MAFFEFVNMSNPLFDTISKEVRKTYPDACILWIQKTSNKNLDSKFSKHDGDIVGAFHGTKYECVSNICSIGFKKEYNTVSAYGTGTYFARDAKTSFSYMKSKDGLGVSYMIYAEVRLTPDTKVVAGKNIFVVTDDSDCIPRYVIAFHKEAKN